MIDKLIEVDIKKFREYLKHHIENRLIIGYDEHKSGMLFRTRFFYLTDLYLNAKKELCIEGFGVDSGEEQEIEFDVLTLDEIVALLDSVSR